MSSHQDDNANTGNQDSSLKQRIATELSPEVEQAVGKFLNDNWHLPEPSSALDAKVLQSFQDRYRIAKTPIWQRIFPLNFLQALFAGPETRPAYAFQYLAAVALIVTCLLGFFIYRLTSRGPQQPDMVAVGNDGGIKDPHPTSPPSNNNGGNNSQTDPKKDPENPPIKPVTPTQPPIKATPQIKNSPRPVPPEDIERGVTTKLDLKGIKKVYVAPATDEWQTNFRTAFINGLNSINNWQVVNTISEADAIFKISVSSGNLVLLTKEGKIVWQTKLNQDKTEPQTMADKLLKELGR